MAEARYQDLSAADRRDALLVAERGGNHKAHLLEKDIWVVRRSVSSSTALSLST